MKQEEMMEQQKQAFNSVLNQVLDQQARARCKVFKIVFEVTLIIKNIN